MSTTDTWQKLAQPEKTAGEIAREIEWVEITEGTEKQIKFAKDLRYEWIAQIIDHRNIANVRYAVVEQVQNGLDLTSIANRTSRRLEYSYLAQDAVNRRAIHILNTSNAKAIIDYFKDIKSQANENDRLHRFEAVIRRPAEYQFDGKRWAKVTK